MRTTATGHPGAARSRGFTLVELLVSLLITFTLLGLLIVGIRAATAGAQAQADEQTVTALSTARDAFRSSFGMEVPLVYDGAPLASAPNAARPAAAPSAAAPVIGSGTAANPYRVNVFRRGEDIAFLRGKRVGTAANGAISDARYSKFSLSYYLVGALEADVDGVDGPGMFTPQVDGLFEGVGRTFGRPPVAHEAFVEGGTRRLRIDPEHVDQREYDEHGAGVAPATPAAARSIAVVDAKGRAFRYYRWEPDPDFEVADDRLGNRADLNIPEVLLLVGRAESPTDPTGGDAELRRARSAIVGAGPNGLFGTEPEATLRDVLNDANTDLVLLRAEAARDNLVRYGS